MTIAISPKIKTIKLRTGVTLPYVEQGSPDGNPVVLLHGVTDSWRSFEPILPYLPPSLHVFALTQRGHGDADRPASGYNCADFASDVLAFLDAREIESAMILGHSMSSSVALRFGLDHPARTSGLVLVGTFVSYQTNPVILEYFEAVVSRLEDPIDTATAREFQESTLAKPIPSASLDVFIAESLKVPARVWRAVFAELVATDFSPELAKVAAPTLIVWGDQDAFCPASDQHELAEKIVGAQLAVYTGTGHAVHWEEPARFVADLTTFVDQVVARR